MNIFQVFKEQYIVYPFVNLAGMGKRAGTDKILFSFYFLYFRLYYTWFHIQISLRTWHATLPVIAESGVLNGNCAQFYIRVFIFNNRYQLHLTCQLFESRPANSHDSAVSFTIFSLFSRPLARLPILRFWGKIILK